MNNQQIGLGAVVGAFAVLTAYALSHHGLVGFFEAVTANWATWQLFVDLCIALVLFLVWMWRDARAHGLSPIPYTILTLVLGSFGPLLYLIRRAGVRAGETTDPALDREMAELMKAAEERLSPAQLQRLQLYYERAIRQGA